MVPIDKQEQIRAMVNSMQDKVNKYEVKLKMQKQNSQQLGMLGNVMPDFDFPEPLINYDEDEETEAQKDSEIESQIEPVGAQIEPVEAQNQNSSDEAQKVEEEEEPQQQIQQSKIFVCNFLIFIVLQGFVKLQGIPLSISMARSNM
jgi:Mg2+/citrate symporter